MITLRLFREDDPGHLIDSYIMGDGDVTVGRDPAAVWVIEDAHRQLSRFHCTICSRDGRLFVRDTSTNGVYLGADRTRVEHSVETAVPAGESIQIGNFVLQVDVDKNLIEDPGNASDMRKRGAPLSDDMCESRTSITSEVWPEPDRRTKSRPDDAEATSEVVMLEAFCEGAQLDPSYLTSEDPVEIMRRLGEMYQQVVVGLGDLMSDRASMKAEYSLDRTTIGATDNNPLKWAPSHRLAVDLICNRTGGFLKGGDAIKECFEDLKGHSLCLVAGSRAAVNSVLERLDPKMIGAEAKPKAGLFMERSDVSMRCMKSAHADLSKDPFNDPDSTVNVAFKRGYEQRANELKEKDPCE